ncbi:hypothetical protein N7508_002463 [Penicillium antarcticum]|uniref:uncharacterized protein n=1 Tax=Penicillium antarcticum TaxID=416450 RepID=UPI0023926155|nr:uncharacterized protein N7508_002463 [Penicillium antarcticum]KAJ5317955.1 hypothetical protein N7508_002463 [Penicillium antarcticum]
MSYPTVLITTIESLRLRLFNKIKAGEFSLVAFIAIPSIRQAQIVARTGNEGIIIDCEHGHIGDDAVHNSVAAISALSVSPVVRIEPMIFSSMPLIQVVRGQGSALPAIGHGLTSPGYMKSANETIITLIEIETHRRRNGLHRVNLRTKRREF